MASNYHTMPYDEGLLPKELDIEAQEWPQPPHKYIKCKRRPRRLKRVNTEFHEALFSLGRNDRTSRLSDEEFTLQVLSEVGYLTETSFRCFSRALGGVFELVRLLFCS